MKMEKKKNGFYQSPSIEVIEVESQLPLNQSPGIGGVIEGEGEEGGYTGGSDDGTGEVGSKDRGGFYEW